MSSNARIDVEARMQLGTEVQFLPGVGPERAERLARLGVKTARDLLFLFPRNYELPAPPTSIARLREGVAASLVGTITDAELRSSSPGRSIFGALVENETGAVRVLFFNQPFRADQLTLGLQVRISGTPRLKGLRMEFVHPLVTPLGEGEVGRETLILPVYPLTDGIRQTELRRLTARVVSALAEQLTEVLPDTFRVQAAAALAAAGYPLQSPLPTIEQAVRSIHQPESEHALQQARSRLIFQELLVMQLALAMRRRQLTTQLKAPPLPPSPILHARILHRFPFEPTADQRLAIAEIGRDMSRQFPMNRLLQGDVGSGKTFVAMYAMLLAVAHRHQAVLMAPTEILARQHQRTLQTALADSRVRIGLLCGSLTGTQRRRVLQETAAGEIDVLVGTQALVDGHVEFARLGLCVIDEQHKFGVDQRVSLRRGDIDPHILVMSATPIPRSIAMTLFGDVDLTTLREKPPGRGLVNTYLARDDWKERWWGFVRQRLDEGRQAFVVAPRLEASHLETSYPEASRDDPSVDVAAARPGRDDSGERTGDEDAMSEELPADVVSPEEIASVRRLYQELSSGPLAGYQIGLLHGRLDPQAKQAIMQDFADGRLQVLVSTTVIEVGIDVPNATVMTILGANRFGLAQLHQLRGRVSRGAHTGHVAVFTDGEGSPEDHERLRIFEQSQDGFELAEADLRLRGPGDLLGRRQSGLPPLRIADLTRDEVVVSVARQLAQDMIDADPELQAESLSELKAQVLRRYEKRLSLGDMA